VKVLAKTDYALRALCRLATSTGDCVSVHTIATDEQIPQRFLELIFADLRRAGLVTSHRGVRGGYRLALPTEELSLAAIVDAVDPALLGRSGPRADSEPSDDALTVVWKAFHAELADFWDGITLHDLISDRLPGWVGRAIRRRELSILDPTPMDPSAR
jgi:Rrf2 family protein